MHKLSSNILFCLFSFLSRICPDRDSLVKDAVDLASQISKKSPIAMSGTKHNLNYSRDHSTKEGLEYMVSFLRMLYECSFISFEKRSACANASERKSPPTRNGLCFIFAPACRAPRGKGVSSKHGQLTSRVHIAFIPGRLRQLARN